MKISPCFALLFCAYVRNTFSEAAAGSAQHTAMRILRHRRHDGIFLTTYMSGMAGACVSARRSIAWIALGFFLSLYADECGQSWLNKAGFVSTKAPKNTANKLRETKTDYERLMQHLAQTAEKNMVRSPAGLPPFVQKDRRRLNTLHPSRNNKSFTWEKNFDVLNSSGHPFCSILRDNHACVGDLYRDVLIRTPTFDKVRFGLQNLPQNSTLLVYGNSFTLETIYLPLCYSHEPWGYWLGANNFLIWTGNIDVLIVDNDRFYAWGKNATSDKLINMLLNFSFAPTHIVLGNINFRGCSNETDFSEVWPTAKIVNMCDHGMGRNCNSNTNDCPAPGGHQCVPSPGAVHSAEKMMHDLVSLRRCKPTRLLLK